MNTPHPRRIEPLAAPPGAFDDVVSRARARRYRRLTAVSSVVGIFLAGIFGGLAMGGGVSGVQQSLYQFASGGGDVPTDTPSTAPSTTSTSSAASVGAASATPHKTTPSAVGTPVVAGGSGPPKRRVRGRVVDGSGDPVAGMLVYTGVNTADGFVPSDAAADVTDVAGRYSIPCRRGSVLLTSWPLNDSLGASADGRWAATFVAKPVCARHAAPRVTTVTPGATIEGTVLTDVSCPHHDFPLWLWLGGDRTASVRLSHLGEGDRFRISGLPVGTQVLGAKDNKIRVAVAGSAITQDVQFACPGVPTPTDTPTGSISPIPTPSETETPLPTDTTGPPSSSATPTPTPTG